MAKLDLREYFQQKLNEVEAERKSLKRILKNLPEGSIEFLAVDISGKKAKKLKEPKPIKEPRQLKSVSKSGNSRGVSRYFKPPDGFVFRDNMFVDEFLAECRAIRLYLKKTIPEAVAATQTSDKNVYAIEARTSNGKRFSIKALADLYGIILLDFDKKFRDDASGWYIGEDKPWIKREPKTPKPAKEPKTLKEPKPIKEKPVKSNLDKLRSRVERQAKSEPTDGLLNNGQPIKRKYATKAQEQDISEKALLPFNLRYRSSDAPHGLKAMVTRNYKRIRVAVQGVCDSKHWEFDGAMAQMHEELESWLSKEKQLDFYSDSEIFMKWVYDIARSMKIFASNLRTTDKTREVEALMGIVPKPTHGDIVEIDAEFRAFMKRNLEYKAGWMKVVFESLVYNGKTIDESARLASKSMHDADACLKLIKRELIANFGNKYNQLMVW